MLSAWYIYIKADWLESRVLELWIEPFAKLASISRRVRCKTGFPMVKLFVG